MALQLRRWLAPFGITLAVIAGGWYWTRLTTRTIRTRALASQGAADTDAGAAAARWRANDLELALARARLAADPTLRHARATSAPTVALLIATPDSLRARADSIFQPALADAWHTLGLGTTKVGVAVALDLTPRFPLDAAPSSTPAPSSAPLLWALPDTGDRSTCVAFVSDRYYTNLLVRRGGRLSRAELAAQLVAQIGPCALIARYGVPGVRVRRWLGRRGWDLAQQMIGIGPTPAEWIRRYLGTWKSPPPWWWETLDQMRPMAHACLGGRAIACRAAVVEGDNDDPFDSLTRFIKPQNIFALNLAPLLAGSEYLPAVAAAAGPARFEEFWNTDLPVDSALSLALGQRVGRWTAEWQRSIAPAPPLGPLPGMADAAVGLGIALAAVTAVALGARRRVVR